jgi:hypothetical protein
MEQFTHRSANNDHLYLAALLKTLAMCKDGGIVCHGDQRWKIKGFAKMSVAGFGLAGLSPNRRAWPVQAIPLAYTLPFNIQGWEWLHRGLRQIETHEPYSEENVV